jgi:hypothetical protein
MPTKLDSFPAAGGQAQYDWDALLDGSPWELIAGADFNGKPTTFATNARHQGLKRGGRVRVRHFAKEQPVRLVIQFVKEQ